MTWGERGGRTSRPRSNASEKGLGESEGDFKTPVPRAVAVGTGIVRGHPFEETACRGCSLAKACGNGSTRLPLLVLEPVQGLPERPCRHGGPMVVCKVRHAPELDRDAAAVGAGEKDRRRLYFLDANIFMNAFNGHPQWGDDCWWVLREADIRIATTDRIIDETYDTHGHSMPAKLEVHDVGEIDEWIRDLRPPEGVKELSASDRSLIQAVCDTPEARGILTYDPDFVRVAVAGLLSSRAGRKIEVLNAGQLRSRTTR